MTPEDEKRLEEIRRHERDWNHGDVAFLLAQLDAARAERDEALGWLKAVRETNEHRLRDVEDACNQRDAALARAEKAEADLHYTRRECDRAYAAEAAALARVAKLEGALEALLCGVEDAVLRFLDSHELSLRPDMDEVLRARVIRGYAALNTEEGT